MVGATFQLIFSTFLFCATSQTFFATLQLLRATLLDIFATITIITFNKYIKTPLSSIRKWCFKAAI